MRIEETLVNAHLLDHDPDLDLVIQDWAEYRELSHWASSQIGLVDTDLRGSRGQRMLIE